MRITIEGTDWGGAPVENIKRLLEDVQDQLFRHVASPPKGQIVVRSRPKATPRVLYRRSADDDYVIELTALGAHWSQYAYQFSHEICHVLSGYDRLHGSANEWFHEALCELSSCFVMEQMAKTWRTKPPYPNWADYAKPLGEYAREVIQREAHQLPPGVRIRDWIIEHEPSLRADHAQRALNGVVAIRLLPLFQAEPTHWGSVRHLPNSNSEFAEYLVEWEGACPGEHKKFVAGLRSNLGW